MRGGVMSSGNREPDHADSVTEPTVGPLEAAILERISRHPNWYPLARGLDEHGNSCYRWSRQTQDMWNERIRPLLDQDIGQFFDQNLRYMRNMPIMPAILIFFPRDYPFSGHCARARILWDNMQIISCDIRRERIPWTKEPPYIKMGAGILLSKFVLRKMAERSPLFRPIWTDLKDMHPDECGIYLAGEPDSGWLDSIQGEEKALLAEYRSTWNMEKLGLDLRPLSLDESMTIYDAMARFKSEGNSVKAIGICREMLEEPSVHWTVWSLLVHFLRQMGEYAQAYEVVQEGKRRYPECLFFDRMGYDCCLDMKEHARAEWHLNRIEPLNPWNPITMAQRADLHRLAGRHAQAVELYRGCAEHRSLEREQQVNLGVSLAGSGRVEEATELFQKMSEQCESDPVALNNLGMLIAGAGQLEKAADLCRRALELDSSISNIWDTMGFVQFKLENHGAAERHFQKAVELDPMFPDAWRHLLHVYHRSGQAEKLAKTRARVAYCLPEELKRFEREKDSDIRD